MGLELMLPQPRASFRLDSVQLPLMFLLSSDTRVLGLIKFFDGLCEYKSQRDRTFVCKHTSHLNLLTSLYLSLNMSRLTLQSTITLSDGKKLPVLGFGALNQAETKDAIIEALKIGYRQIDGAQMYENEDKCGEAIRESGIPRENIFATSKIASSHRGHGYENVTKGVDESLEKWGLKYLDLFLIHDPLNKEKRLESYKALLDAQTAGKIKSVGVSNYGVKHLEEIKKAGYPLPVVNQIELHPFLQQHEIAAYCKVNNIIIQAYCPIIRGASHPKIDAVATKHKKEPAQVLIRWSLQKGYVPLPKSGTPSRILSNTNVFDFELSDEDIASIDELEQNKPCSWNPVNVD